MDAMMYTSNNMRETMLTKAMVTPILILVDEDIGCFSVSFSGGVVMFVYRAPVWGGLQLTLSQSVMGGQLFLFGTFDAQNPARDCSACKSVKHKGRRN